MPLITPPVGSVPLYARNKVTGETYLVGPSAQMIDDLADVDTSTTGPTGGSALVWDAALGQWVPGPGGLQISTDADNEVMLGTDGGLYSNEVHLGVAAPTLTGPDLWADADSGTIYAASTGPTGVTGAGGTMWVPVGGVDKPPGEVHVGTEDPDIAIPGSAAELWFDTNGVPPPGINIRLDWWDVAIAYPSGSRVIWSQADPFVWIAARDTVAGEEPGIVDDAWTSQAEVNGPYLPLSGGTMDSGAQIKFPGEVGDKIILYPGTSGRSFNIAVQGGQIRHEVEEASNKHSFWIGGAEKTAIEPYGIITKGGGTFHSDSHDNTNNVHQNNTGFKLRRADGQELWHLYGYRGGHWHAGVQGKLDSQFKLKVAAGQHGYLEAFESSYATNPVQMFFQGTVSANDVVDRSSLETKTDVADLDPQAARNLLAAVRPITFARVLPLGETFPDEGVEDSPASPPPPYLRVGVAVEDLEGPEAIPGLVRAGGGLDPETGADMEPERRGVSIPGLLSVAISVIQQQGAEIAALTARLDELDQSATTRKKEN